MNKFQLQSQTKSSSTAFLLLFFFGMHYAYLGKWGIQILFWCTLGGVLLWWFIDLFRVGGLVEKHNAIIYEQIEEIEKRDKLHDIAMIRAATK